MSAERSPLLERIRRLDPPWRLLLVSLRRGDALTTFFQEFSLSPGEWKQWLNLNIQHAVLPLVYRRFRDEGLLRHVPNSIKQRMQKLYLANISGNMRKINDLQKFCREIRERGLSILLFKGPASSQLAYRDPALRTYTDIDVVIRPRELEPVLEVLEEKGFSLSVDPTTRIRRYLHQTGRDFSASRGTMYLDFHQRITKGPAFFSLPVEVWQNTRILDIQGYGFQTFSLEDTVVFLAIHCAKDGWNSFKTLHDLARLIRISPLDWDRVFRLAAVFKSRLILKIALYFTTELLGESLPGEVRRRLEGCPRAQRKFWFFSRRLFARRFRLDLMTWYATIPRCLDTPVARLRFYAWFLTHPSPMLHQGFFKIPAPLFSIYPLLAPFYMVFQYRRERSRGKGL